MQPIPSYPPLDPEWIFPSSEAITCGLRTYLPRRLRRHDYRYAGTDVRHQFRDGAYADCHVAICIACGHDTEQRLDEGELMILRASAVRRALEKKYGADMVSDELVALVMAELAEESA
jgi:hypothetical protein